MHLDPLDANVTLLLERGITGPLTMLNLIRLRDVADYSATPELVPNGPISGRKAYDRYIEHTLPYLEATGGSLTFLGDGGHFFIGPTDERWDVVMLVRQNSIDDFFGFAADEGYLAGIVHRTAAVADSRLLPIVERPGPDGP